MCYFKFVLDYVEFRVNYEREYFWGGWSYECIYEVFNWLVEFYLFIKSQQCSFSVFLDVVWEWEEVVVQVMDKIVGICFNVFIVGWFGIGKSVVFMVVLKCISNQFCKQQLGYIFWCIMLQ